MMKHKKLCPDCKEINEEELDECWICGCPLE